MMYEVASRVASSTAWIRVRIPPMQICMRAVSRDRPRAVSFGRPGARRLDSRRADDAYFAARGLEEALDARASQAHAQARTSDYQIKLTSFTSVIDR